MATITIEGTKDLEDMLKFVLDEGGEALADQIDIRRESAPVKGLGGEPLSTAAVITLTITIAPYVTRLIERWMEKRGQAEQMTIVAGGFGISDAAGEALTELGKKHADVSISYKLIDPKSGKRASAATKGAKSPS